MSKQLESWMADLKVETLDSINCRNKKNQIRKEPLVKTWSSYKNVMFIKCFEWIYHTELTWYKEFKALNEDSWDNIPLACCRSRYFNHGRAHAKIAPLKQKES